LCSGSFLCFSSNIFLQYVHKAMTRRNFYLLVAPFSDIRDVGIMKSINLLTYLRIILHCSILLHAISYLILLTHRRICNTVLNITFFFQVFHTHFGLYGGHQVLKFLFTILFNNRYMFRSYDHLQVEIYTMVVGSWRT
jgi:hypothetical protein